MQLEANPKEVKASKNNNRELKEKYTDRDLDDSNAQLLSEIAFT